LSVMSREFVLLRTPASLTNNLIHCGRIAGEVVQIVQARPFGEHQPGDVQVNPETVERSVPLRAHSSTPDQSAVGKARPVSCTPFQLGALTGCQLSTPSTCGGRGSFRTRYLVDTCTLTPGVVFPLGNPGQLSRSIAARRCSLVANARPWMWPVCPWCLFPAGVGYSKLARLAEELLAATC
jgi:hypothetical protein